MRQVKHILDREVRTGLLDSLLRAETKPCITIKWKWKCQDIPGIQMKIYSDSGKWTYSDKFVMASFSILPLSLLPRSGLYFFFFKKLICRRRQWHPTPVLLPGKSYGQRILVGCRPWGRWVRHDSDFTSMHWRRKWQPTPVFLPGESQGQGSLVGCCLWGRTESDTTDAT